VEKGRRKEKEGEEGGKCTVSEEESVYQRLRHAFLQKKPTDKDRTDTSQKKVQGDVVLMRSQVEAEMKKDEDNWGGGGGGRILINIREGKSRVKKGALGYGNKGHVSHQRTNVTFDARVVARREGGNRVWKEDLGRFEA